MSTTLPVRNAERSFDDHWKSHDVVAPPQSKLDEAARFLEPLAEFLRSFPNAEILDAGCGDGIHLAVLRENRELRAQLTALDLSHQALTAASRHLRNSWRSAQADVGALPFADDCFDAVFSFGVIAYTPDPRRAFAELCRVVRPGGLIGIWCYPRRRGLLQAAFQVVRSMCRWGGPQVAARIADCLVPLLPILPTRSRITLANATWRQCREVVLVNIAPTTLHLFDADELAGYFAMNRCEIVRRDDERPITLWGRKLTAGSPIPPCAAYD